MLSNKAEAIRISRLLTPDHQALMLDRVRLAYAAENSVRRSLGKNAANMGVLTFEPQDCSCPNISLRRIKE